MISDLLETIKNLKFGYFYIKKRVVSLHYHIFLLSFRSFCEFDPFLGQKSSSNSNRSKIKS